MNLPNKLTLLRLLLVPFYVYLAYYTPYSLAALIVFSVAALTDLLDGYYARKHNLITEFGKLMDPLADKFLTISAFTVFNALGLLSPVVLLIVCLREISISVFRALAASKDVVIAASIYGKIKTILQMVVIILIHLHQIFHQPLSIWMILLIALMALMTLLSAVDYLWKNRKVLK